MRRWQILGLFLLSLAFACSEADPDPACPLGQVPCGDTCVDLSTSQSHCGTCGTVCAKDLLCVRGTCQPSCDENQTACGDVCVDTSSNPNHCGGCDHGCRDGAVCKDGSCQATCGAEELACNGSCVDPLTNGSHCGGCDSPCGDTEICEAGACICPEGTAACDGACVDTQTDPAHCGGCGEACSIGPNMEAATCDAGTCAATCLPGFEDCDGEASNGCEADLGAPESCGTCGVSCRADQVCADGACGCPAGWLECEGTCVDVGSDVHHCGACGLDCREQENVDDATCEAGACVFSCGHSFRNCDDDPTTGCETWARDNPDHCGGCGIACRADEVCTGTTCGCPGGLTDCDGACVDTLVDQGHCGGCGLACAEGAACAAGACCADGLAACGSTCADLDTHPEHCGACGASCLHANVDTATCAEGACASISCMEGFEDCNGALLDGCETDVFNDPANCGTCGAPPCHIGCGLGSCLAVVELSARNDHGCARMSDGTLRCWGYNRDGQIGNGQLGTNALKPEQVLDPAAPSGFLHGAVEVGTGFSHTCIRTPAGNVTCWGNGLDPVSGAPIQRTEPFPIPDPTHPSGLLSDVESLASGRNFLCAVLTDGTAKCWGAIPNGGTNPAPHALPTPLLASDTPPTPLGGIVQIAAGNMHLCALMQDGTARCLGVNTHGQLGVDPATTPFGTGAGSSLPVIVGDATPLGNITQLAAAQDHTCALLDDRTAKCWGQNNHGNLGDGTIVPSHVPVEVVGLQGAIHLSAGMVNHTCATLDDGTAKCWGNNGNGKLGVGPVGSRSSTALPVLDDAGQPLVGILRVEAGNAHTCVALQANEVLCWGRNNNGQIGDGTTTTAAAPTAVQW